MNTSKRRQTFERFFVSRAINKKSRTKTLQNVVRLLNVSLNNFIRTILID